MRRALVLVLVALGSASPSLGCGGADHGPDDIQRALASVDARLRGAWRLVSFTPETSLEPTMQALLAFQYGRLVVRFDGHRLVADSPGIHADRAYTIRQVIGDRFQAVSYDDQGVPYESWCELMPDGTLQVRSETTPWRGIATLRRDGP
jgi:hypothetical protein